MNRNVFRSTVAGLTLLLASCSSGPNLSEKYLNECRDRIQTAIVYERIDLEGNSPIPNQLERYQSYHKTLEGNVAQAFANFEYAIQGDYDLPQRWKKAQRITNNLSDGANNDSRKGRYHDLLDELEGLIESDLPKYKKKDKLRKMKAQYEFSFDM